MHNEPVLPALIVMVVVSSPEHISYNPFHRSFTYLIVKTGVPRTSALGLIPKPGRVLADM